MEELDFRRISEKIRLQRQSKKITQQALAEALDVNPSHISNIECGRAKPSLTILVRIASVLDCSVDAFLGEEYDAWCGGDRTLESRIAAKARCLTDSRKNQILQIMEVL